MSYSNPTPYPSVTTVLRPFVDFSAVPPKVLAAAADRGSRCHSAIAEHLMDGFPVIDADVRPYFESFMVWADRMIESVIMVEDRMTDEVMRYTGQVDLIARLKGDSEYTMIDFKTSQVGMKAWQIQIAAYRHLAMTSGINTARGMTVRLKKDGSGAILTEYPPKCANDFNVFLGLLNAHYFFNPKTDIDWENL